jgi:D,D-heptose 1,7-bisphosphate phosphatase
VNRAAFLDRDGVINVDRAYVSRWADFTFLPGAVDAVRQLREAGYQPIVVTNQSGIARGFFGEDEFLELNRQMLETFVAAGATIAGVYYCPHLPDGKVLRWRLDCNCRKPKPGMLLRAAMEHDLSLSESLLIGDKHTDIMAARAARVGRAYLVRADRANTAADPGEADAIFDDLAHCVATVLKP